MFRNALDRTVKPAGDPKKLGKEQIEQLPKALHEGTFGGRCCKRGSRAGSGGS
jgi:hypothetical protein